MLKNFFCNAKASQIFSAKKYWHIEILKIYALVGNIKMIL